MNNKDRYKKEMKSIKPSRGLVEDTINMIKDNKLEKKNFWSVYKKPMVAFAASFVVLASFVIYTYQNSSSVFQKTTVNDVKANKFITAEESDKEFAKFLNESGLSEINKENDSNFIITMNGKGVRTDDYSTYEIAMRYTKYINRYKYISYFRSKDVFTEEQGYKYMGVDLKKWIIVNVNDKYKICVPDTVDGAVIIVDLKAKDFTFYKLYINTSNEDNKQFLQFLRKGLTDIYNNANSTNNTDSVVDNENNDSTTKDDNNSVINESTTTEEKSSESKYIPKLYGDVSRDGVINSWDATLIRKFISGTGNGFDPVQYELADVNGDGEITGLDATLIQYAVVHAIDFDGKKQIKNVTLFGDVSKSGKIEQADYDILNSYLDGNMELDNIQKASADVNEDGKVNRVDLLIIEGMINGYFSYDMLNPVLDYTLYGDVNGDGYIRSYDASMILQYLQKGRILDPQQMKNADVNVDGKVDDRDRELIQEYVVQMHEGTLPFKPIK